MRNCSPKQVAHRCTAQNGSFKTSMSHKQAHATHPTVECRWPFHQRAETTRQTGSRKHRCVSAQGDQVDPTQVKEGIVFQRAAEDYSPPLERLTIQIHLSPRRWAMIHNLYVAPVKGPTSSDSLNLNNISVGPFTLAAGDLNADSSRLGRTPASQPARRGSRRLAYLQTRQHP